MDNANYQLLVVDDEIGVRQSLVTYLEDSGFKVDDAPDAVIGLELFKRIRPDLVITDLSMPNIDGLIFLQQIHKFAPSTPVIVISGAGVMGDVVQSLRLGASDYLIKPIIDMEVLVHAVCKSLERSQLLVDNQRYRQELEQANSQLKRHISILEQDQKAGHFIQQSMLPLSPFYFGDCMAEYKVIPSLYLSGDCIDYAFVKQRYYAFYLADVSGHGSAPAFVTIWLKNLVSQLVRLKQLLFSVIDTKTNTLSYSVAGHLPLPILYHQGKATFLAGSGKPIGLFPSTRWEIFTTQLPDDAFSLILFSDGILELLEPKELQQKEQGLLQLVGVALLAELPDDIAVLSIKKVC